MPVSRRAVLSLLLLACAASANTLRVGPNEVYKTPCQAIAAAADGDLIEILPGNGYLGDVCQIARNNLTLRGIQGRPSIAAGGAAYGKKGIWVITGNNTVVENLEFSGASVPDRNGAGIRLDVSPVGALLNLTVRNCSFHHNEDGILTGISGNILIEDSEFAYNGYGDGQSHNMYIGAAQSFTLRGSYSHHAVVGHLVKSRAQVNIIQANRLTEETTGTGSYELDLPNGGLTYVIGNVLQQGPATGNSTLFAYMEEGPASGVPHALYVVNNTFVNQSGKSVLFINVDSRMTSPVILRNNLFVGPGTQANNAKIQADHNVAADDGRFAGADHYDYQLTPASPALNAGGSPGTVGTTSLHPDLEYVHPACTAARSEVGLIDVGAYEYAAPIATVNCGSAAPAVQLKDLVLEKSSVTGGQTARATLTLTAPAPSSGVTLYLQSSKPAVVGIPDTVDIRAGDSALTLALPTLKQSIADQVELTAFYQGAYRVATLKLPLPAKPLEIANVTPQTSPIASGQTTTVTLTLSGAAPSGGASIRVWSGRAPLTVPMSVRVPPGATSVQFPVTAKTVGSSTTAVVWFLYQQSVKRLEVEVRPTL